MPLHALVVNPYDVDGIARTIEQALTMPPAHRTARMHALRARVLENTVARWADHFAGALDAAAAPASVPRLVATPCELRRRLDPLLRAQPLVLLLDYDGTLQPIAPTPALARPDDALIELLRRVGCLPDTLVHVISGRPREVLQQWLGGLPIALWAEHGFWHQPCGGQWSPAGPIPTGWRDKVEPIVAHFTAATPGSAMEVKSASITWHYRLADPQFGARQAHELRILLGDALSNQPLEVREGKKSLELRLRGSHKGLPIAQTIDAAGPTAALVAGGDDATDEDMFAALPEGGADVHVGDEPSRADYQLSDPEAVRQWLALVAGSAPNPGRLGR